MKLRRSTAIIRAFSSTVLLFALASSAAGLPEIFQLGDLPIGMCIRLTLSDYAKTFGFRLAGGQVEGIGIHDVLPPGPDGQMDYDSQLLRQFGMERTEDVFVREGVMTPERAKAVFWANDAEMAPNSVHIVAMQNEFERSPLGQALQKQMLFLYGEALPTIKKAVVGHARLIFRHLIPDRPSDVRTTAEVDAADSEKDAQGRLLDNDGREIGADYDNVVEISRVFLSNDPPLPEVDRLAFANRVAARLIGICDRFGYLNTRVIGTSKDPATIRLYQSMGMHIVRVIQCKEGPPRTLLSGDLETLSQALYHNANLRIKRHVRFDDLSDRRAQAALKSEGGPERLQNEIHTNLDNRNREAQTHSETGLKILGEKIDDAPGAIEAIQGVDDQLKNYNVFARFKPHRPGEPTSTSVGAATHSSVRGYELSTGAVHGTFRVLKDAYQIGPNSGNAGWDQGKLSVLEIRTVIDLPNGRNKKIEMIKYVPLFTGNATFKRLNLFTRPGEPLNALSGRANYVNDSAKLTFKPGTPEPGDGHVERLSVPDHSQRGLKELVSIPVQDAPVLPEFFGELFPWSDFMRAGFMGKIIIDGKPFNLTNPARGLTALNPYQDAGSAQTMAQRLTGRFVHSPEYPEPLSATAAQVIRDTLKSFYPYRNFLKALSYQHNPDVPPHN